MRLEPVVSICSVDMADCMTISPAVPRTTTSQQSCGWSRRARALGAPYTSPLARARVAPRVRSCDRRIQMLWLVPAGAHLHGKTAERPPHPVGKSVALRATGEGCWAPPHPEPLHARARVAPRGAAVR